MSSSASRDSRRMSITRECHRSLSVKSSRRESVCRCNSIHNRSRKVKTPDIYTLRRIFGTIPDCLERYQSVSQRKSQKVGYGQRLLSFAKGIRTRVPFIDSMRNYNVKDNLIADLIAGLGTTGLHFPQGLAYGILAGLTPAIGMISTIFPVLIYMFFGSATHTSIGTNSIVSIMVGDMLLDPVIKEQVDAIVRGDHSNGTMTLNNSNVPPVSLGESNVSVYLRNDFFEEAMQYKISIVSGVTLYTGLIFVILAVFRMGFLVTYLSQSFMSGFTTAVAFHIFSSQVKTALGVKIHAVGGVGKLIKLYYEIFSNISSANVSDIIVTVVCVAILMLVKVMINERKKLKVPVPIDAILLVVATVISHIVGLPEKIKVESLGKVELGIPSPTVPVLTPVAPLVMSAIQIALVTFFLNLSVIKIIARKNGYEINENVETNAYAFCNIISSFFSNMPASINPPRASLLSSMGAKTTFSGVSTVAIMLALVFYFGQFFESCPRAVLASMIMVATKDLLMQVNVLPKLWRVNKNDFTTWIIAATTCVVIDIPYGLMFGVLASLISVINQSQKGWVSVLGKSDDEDLFLDKSEFGLVKEIPRIKIVRMESSLYFATAEMFRKTIYKIIESDADKRKETDMEMSSLEEGSTNVAKLQDDTDDKDNTAATNYYGDSEDQIKSVIIIDCIPINFIDGTGLDMLKLVVFELTSIGIVVYLARCSRYMTRLLDKSDFYDFFARDHVFVDIPDALHAAQILLSTSIPNHEHEHANEPRKSGNKTRRRTLMSLPSFRDEDGEVPYDHFLERHGSIFNHV